jgi:surface protein
MVVKMLKKILTRKKSPVSKRKYTKKNTKKVKKIPKKGGVSQPSQTRSGVQFNSDLIQPGGSAGLQPTIRSIYTDSKKVKKAKDDAEKAKRERDEVKELAQKEIRRRQDIERQSRINELNLDSARKIASTALGEQAAAQVRSGELETKLKSERKNAADQKAASEAAAAAFKVQAAEAEDKAKAASAASAAAEKASQKSEMERERIEIGKEKEINNMRKKSIESEREAQEVISENNKRLLELEKEKTSAFKKAKEEGKDKAMFEQEKENEITNIKKENKELKEAAAAGAFVTNKAGERIPVTAKLETNLKGDEPLPLMAKVFKKGTVKIYDESEYFNLDNYSLSRLISYWYGSKKPALRKVFSFFGGDKPPVPIKDWDVSQVTNMSNLFANAPDFNEDISGWDVSNVQDMRGMFKDTTMFNQNINEWDVGNVRNMEYMFYNAKAFNMYLDQWNTGRVTTMGYMFSKSKKFNRVIDTWNVSSVTDMTSMFAETNYNKPLSSWNVSNVVKMSNMFKSAVKFNQPLAQWGSKLTNLKYVDMMFHEARDFKQDLSDWNLSKIGVPISMFHGTRMPNDFSPIGQKVNVQEQFTGLTPAEEEKMRKEQEQEQLEIETQKFLKQRDIMKNTFEKIKVNKKREMDKFLNKYDDEIKRLERLREIAKEEEKLDDELDVKQINEIADTLKEAGVKDISRIHNIKQFDADKQKIILAEKAAALEKERQALLKNNQPPGATPPAPGNKVPQMNSANMIEWINKTNPQKTIDDNTTDQNKIRNHILTILNKQNTNEEWKNFYDSHKGKIDGKFLFAAAGGQRNPKNPKGRHGRAQKQPK